MGHDLRLRTFICLLLIKIAHHEEVCDGERAREIEKRSSVVEMMRFITLLLLYLLLHPHN